MDRPPPHATAADLRALAERGVLTRQQTAALEHRLRALLPWKLWSERLLLAVGAGLAAAGVFFSRIGVHKFWDLLALLALLNAAALAAREIGVRRGLAWLEEGWLRALPLLAVFGSLTTAICGMIVFEFLGGMAWLPLVVWLG